MQVQGYYQTTHGQGIQIVGNYIHHAPYDKTGIWASNVKDMLIENNEISYNDLNGIYIADSGRDAGRTPAT